MIRCVFIDMDNTIAENTTCDNVDYHSGLYLSKRPIQIVIDGILTLYEGCTFIIISKTAGGSRGMLEKKAWLSEYFPYASETILISPTDTKRPFIENYIEARGLKPKECLLIDDKKEILQDCKKLLINVKYPQQIICDYEQHNVRIRK